MAVSTAGRYPAVQCDVDDLRAAPGQIELPPEEFRRLGHDLVDAIADFLDSLPAATRDHGRVATQIRAALGDGRFPSTGRRRRSCSTKLPSSSSTTRS